MWILLEAGEGNIENWWVGKDKESLKEAVMLWAEKQSQAFESSRHSYETDMSNIMAILNQIGITEYGKYVLNEYVKEPHHYPSLELIIMEAT